jgi:pimeloyl-ACP methyl ester carboxylesterase
MNRISPRTLAPAAAWLLAVVALVFGPLLREAQAQCVSTVSTSAGTNLVVLIPGGPSVGVMITLCGLSGGTCQAEYHVSSLPPGVTISYNHAPTCWVSPGLCCTLRGATTADFYSFLLNADASAPPGDYSTTISSSANQTVLNIRVGGSVSLSTSASTLTVTAGECTSATMNATLAWGTSELVKFSTSGHPAGLGVTFTPSDTCTPPCTQTVWACPLPTTPVGTYQVTVNAFNAAGTLVGATTLQLQVVDFNFSLSASPGTLTVNPGESGSTTITATKISGTAQPVTYSVVSGLPTGASASFGVAACTPTCSSALTISTSPTTPEGTYTVTVEATTGGANPVTRQTDVTLIVQSPVRAHLGVNCNNDGEMREGVPDVGFIIDEKDEALKRSRGFDFWWAENSGRVVELSDLVDLAPLRIQIPDSLVQRGTKFYLKAKGTGLHSLILYKAAYPADGDRRLHLKTPAAGVAQVALANNTAKSLPNGALVEIPNWVEAGPNSFFETTISAGGTYEFLFKAVRDEFFTAEVTLELLVQKPSDAEPVLHDSVKLTLKNASAYWRFVSFRGVETAPFDYNTGEGAVWSVRRPVLTNQQGPPIDPTKPTVVFVHGFNVSEDDAKATFSEVYKRLYWLGFRGNFIGFAWRGDIGNITSIDPGAGATIHWYNNVDSALHTAPSLLLFLRDLRSQVGAQKIDVIAHSLGNLVVSDALRLNQLTPPLPEGPLIRNYITIEPAVWEEAYSPESNLEYKAPSTPIIYDTTALKRHSWRSWFNQQRNDPRSSVAGKVYHSYYFWDRPLIGMQSIDFFVRGYWPPLIHRRWHFDRDKVIDNLNEFRGPEGSQALPSLPALMKRNSRKANYVLEASGMNALELPVGRIPNPWAHVKYPAASGGWGAHTTPTAHSDYREVPFPVIYGWYHQYLYLFGAIPIGKDQ